MSQLQVTGEAKIRDIQGPVVANSGVITALDGAASQYVRGDGTLADFPTSSGGGSSVSYYLNSSVSQGTIGGVAYRELSKEPIIGAGTDIAISANGYVASYLTDANDPDVVIVPGGNFNCEFYFSVNNNTGSPTTYAELYKYDGTTFTLLGTSAGVPESINQGTVINPYYFAIPVATAALALTDRLAIRIFVNVDGRTVTLHTENGHLCQVVTTLSKGMVSLNNLTDQSQFLTTGTSGTDFNIVSSGDTHTFNLPTASATNTGKLSSTDWSVFNNKQAALTFTAPLVNTSNTISIPAATSLVDGYLDNADFTKFNTAYNDSIISAAVTGTTTKTLTLNQQDGGTVTASWTDDNTDAVTSVFGRTGAVVATSGDYTTTQVTEGTNLYFTNARAQSAITGGASTITTSNLDTSKALSSNSSGKVVTSITTATELSYLSGVSSNVQTQLDGKAATFTLGSVSSSPTSVLVITGSGAPVNGSLTFTINQSSSSQNGYLSSTDWSTFNNKQGAITLTTTGTSGAATLVGNTLNIPNYTPDLSGYVTIGTIQTITGTKTFSGANRQESGILLKNGVLTGLAGYTSLAGATNGLDVQLSGSSNIQTLIFQSGAAYSYTLPATSGTLALTSQLTSGTVTSVGLSSATSGVTIGSSPITTSGTITLAIATASGSQNGLLSSTDWTTFNNKQSALTNPVTGTGTTNYLPKFTGASIIGNSIVQDDGTNATVGGGLTSSSFLRVNRNGSDSLGAGAFFALYNTAFTSAIFQQLNASNGLDWWNTSSKLMTLTSSGNLGLGVTPSAWGTYKAYQVGWGSIASYDGADTAIFSNTYFDGGTWRYIGTGNASQYRQLNSVHSWFTAPSGTAGNAISFTQAMTLFSTGNLGVGVGGTDAGYKLDVNGTGRFSGNLIIQNTSDTYGLTLAQSNALNAGWGQWADTSGNYKLSRYGGGSYSSPALTIALTGAATFSSSVTATQFNVGTGTFNFSSGDALLDYSSASVRLRTFNPGVGYITPLTIVASTGAATFSSSVDTNSYIRNTNTGANTAVTIAADGTSHYIQSTNAARTVYNNLLLNPYGANVGIGTTSPYARLSVVQDITTTAEFGSFGQFTLQGATNPNKLLSFGFNTAADAGFIQAMVNGSSYNNLLLNARGGNVLIGTTTDNGQKLQINGAVRTDNVGLIRASSFRGGLYTYDAVTGSGTDYGMTIFAEGGTGNGNIYFCPGGSVTKAMTITSGGNVLIGTTTDAGYKLDVNGSARVSGATIITGLLTNYNTFNTQTASYTLVLADASKIVETNVASANTVTVPTNASVAFPIGTEITVMQYGAGVTTIASAGGVTINSKSNARIIANRYTGATLVKRGTDEWYLIGNIVP